VQIIKTSFQGLLIWERSSYKDNRGYFRELFLKKKIKKDYIFDYLSLSKKNVVRGLHLQLNNPQGKLITVLNGKIFDVALDCRKNSKTFGKYFTIFLSEKDNKSVYIPEGFAHGFCSLTDNSILHYKCTTYRDQKSETGILWNDETLKIKWPIKKPIISLKDKKNLKFDDFLNLKKFKNSKW
jgi:dTDP-4-dehydrorhamnose 3,5-epimerase